jgi:hypothetical protein
MVSTRRRGRARVENRRGEARHLGWGADLVRICIAHDFFRSPALDPALGSADRTGRFLAALLTPILQRLGHEVQRLSEIQDGRSDSVTRLLARHGWPASMATWARLFSDPAAAPAIWPMIAPLAGFDLVIGWELPPNIMRLLHAAGRPFIDVGIHAIRFAPDLFLRVRSNDPARIDRLARLEAPEEALAAEAARLTETRPPDAAPRPSAMVFAGQMEIDSSLVADAALARVDPFIPRIASLLEPEQTLLLKPHPHGAPHTDIVALHRAFPHSRVIDDNIYDLLAAPWVDRIATLSSSVADEAALFGKRVERLITPDNDPARVHPGISRYHRIDARFATGAFWAHLLSGVSDAAGTEPGAMPIRRMFTHRWGHTPWPPPRPSRRVSPGSDVRFGTGGTGQGLCVGGWSAPEEWGVWSDSDVATLLIEPEAAPRGLHIALTLIAFIAAPGGSLRVRFDMRPHGPARDVVFTGGDPQPFAIDVPAAWCGKGAIEISFTFADLISPEAAGLGPDGRRLGVGLCRLVAREGA